MDKKITIVVADDNVQFGDLLNEYVNQESDLQVVGVARDGVQAVDLVRNMLPDMVVLDIIMPNLDGIGVLEKLASLNLEKKPIYIMLSAIGQDTFVRKAISLGAEYYIVKPFDIDILISRIRQAYEERNSNTISGDKSSIKYKTFNTEAMDSLHSIEISITNLMRDIGIPPHMIGYQYIREATLQALKSSKGCNSITKHVYPIVAQKFNTTPQKVERAIRNAIDSTWARGKPDAIDALFGYTVNFNKNKPGNTELIAMMAEKIRVSGGYKL